MAGSGASFSGLEVRLDNIAKIMGSIKTLTEWDVLVGFPQDQDVARETTGVGLTNAYLAFIQEHGSPANNIPARPFMIPGVRSIHDRAVQMLKQAALKGLEGRFQESQDILHALGLIGVSAIQRAITVGEGWAPLAARTLAARRARGVKRTHPLVDTGQLRQHVTYVLRRKQVGGFQILQQGLQPALIAPGPKLGPPKPIGVA